MSLLIIIWSLNFSQLAEVRQHCAMECLQGSADSCCFDECFAFESGVYKNDFFNVTALQLSITRLDTFEKEFIDATKNSIKKCKSKRGKSPAGTFICDMPATVVETSQCVLTENYLACPEMQSKECLSFQKFLKPCKAITSPPPKTTKAIKPKSG